jgi:hypothetical protein
VQKLEVSCEVVRSPRVNWVIFKSEVVRLFLEYGVQHFLMTALCSHFYFYSTYEMSDEMNLQRSAVAPSCLIDPKRSTIFDDGLYHSAVSGLSDRWRNLM